MSIIDTIHKFVPDDAQLSQLFQKVQEYAELYLIAKQRQKGCDGMGEVATLKDELIYYMEEVIKYCKKKGYLSEDISYDIDSIARQILKKQLEH